uniref:Uncharacterized protein n=1 Tax=Strongyloides stercoralis TaxID=6248 RepID=A0AAF5DNB5_STRER
CTVKIVEVLYYNLSFINTIPNYFVCSNRHEMKLQVRKQSRRMCYVKECRKEIGIRIKTWFESIKISSKREFYLYITSPLKRLRWNFVRRSWRRILEKHELLPTSKVRSNKHEIKLQVEKEKSV